MPKKRLLFIFSDTGGGHRSAAEAVQEAIEAAAGDQIEISLVDFLKDYAPLPFSRLPSLYPLMVKEPRLWGLGYRWSNSLSKTRILGRITWPYVSRKMNQLLADNPADAVVSFHALANDALARSLEKRPQALRPYFAVVVTDLVSTHAFWFHSQSQLTVVPTNDAYQHAMRSGLSTDKVVELGLPVAARFCQTQGDKISLRRRLEWPEQQRMVLLVGGGDGMGPIAETAEAIATSNLPLGLAVITGRNTKLFAELSLKDWPVPVFIYSFVKNMPEMMQAADVLVTKGGSVTISEGLVAGLPMIIYSFLPGQESGNISFLTEQGAGIWAPTAETVIAGLTQLFETPAVYDKAVRSARALARPEAAKQIAHLLLDQIKV